MRVEFLPPYSPGLNPIELAFSEMKRQLRGNGEYARLATTERSDGNGDISYPLRMALYEITSRPFSWFRDCGYMCSCCLFGNHT